MLDHVETNRIMHSLGNFNDCTYVQNAMAIYQSWSWFKGSTSYPYMQHLMYDDHSKQGPVPRIYSKYHMD